MNKKNIDLEIRIKMKLQILLYLLLPILLISGCVQEPEAPPIGFPPTQPEPTGLQECPFECCPGVEYIRKNCPNPELACQDNECVLPGGYTEPPLLPADLTQLTFFEEEGKAVDPDWSPDGSQVVFCFTEGSLENSKLYVINADGTGLTEIGLGIDPSWSPVEDKIAYSSNNQIYTMNSDGTEITQLTTEYSNGVPAWSPDGTKIVYSYYEAGKPSIWIMNSDGSEKNPLTTSSDGECGLPSFSPDGSKIVYVKGPTWNTIIEMLPTKLNEIWVMNSDGSNKHRIYSPGDSYLWPFQRAWNKNNEILFMKNGIYEDKLPKMFIISPDGTNPRHMFSLPKDSLGRPELFYLDPVWDNTGIKVAAVKKVIDGPQNIVTFSWEG